MTTLKLKFRPSTQPNTEGTLYFQLIHKRRVKWFSTQYHILPNEWNEKNSTIHPNPNSQRYPQVVTLKAAITDDLERSQQFIDQLLAQSPHLTHHQLSTALKKLPPCKTVFTFLQEQIAQKKLMQRQGTQKNYANSYRRFREFRKNIDLSFRQLTPQLIQHYEAWLTNRGLKQNTIRFYLRTLNTQFNKAVSQGITPHHHWFSQVRLSYVKTTKRAISVHDIQTIERLSLPAGSPLAFARDVFMFSFYMRGMPFVDIAYLKKSNLKYGLLEYCRKKTNQPLSIVWEEQQQTLVERYAHLAQHTPYMFPIIRRTDGTEYQQYRTAQDTINRNLKKIGTMIGLCQPLTLYVARHSWASIARNMNFSVAIISECMGHHSYRTTQIYLDSINTTLLYDVNKKIIQRIQKGK